METRQARWIYPRVVVLLIDHVHLRPGGELHVVVRALQACIRYSISRVHTSLEASGEWQVAASCPARQGRAGLRWTRCMLLGILHLPSSLRRARPDFLPTILAMVGRLTVWVDLGRSNYSSRRVQWQMLGTKLGKDGMDLQDRRRRWRRRVRQSAWLTSQWFTCGGVICCWATIRLCVATRESRARDVETTRQLLWPLSWALAFGRGSHSSFLPRDASPLLSQALTTD